MKLIIKVEDGKVTKVYANSEFSLPFQIYLHDNSNAESVEYLALEKQIEKGMFMDLNIEKSIFSKPLIDYDLMPNLDPDVFILIKDPSSPEDIRKLQQLYCCFTDGYLTGVAELKRYIMKIYRADKETQAIAHELSHHLEKFFKAHNKRYYSLCDFINNRKELESILTDDEEIENK